MRTDKNVYAPGEEVVLSASINSSSILENATLEIESAFFFNSTNFTGSNITLDYIFTLPLDVITDSYPITYDLTSGNFTEFGEITMDVKGLNIRVTDMRLNKNLFAPNESGELDLTLENTGENEILGELIVWNFDPSGRVISSAIVIPSLSKRKV